MSWNLDVTPSLLAGPIKGRGVAKSPVLGQSSWVPILGLPLGTDYDTGGGELSPRTSPALCRLWAEPCWEELDFVTLPLVALSGLFLLLPGPWPPWLPWDYYGDAYTRGLLHVPAPTLLFLMELKSDLTWTGRSGAEP